MNDDIWRHNRYLRSFKEENRRKDMTALGGGDPCPQLSLKKYLFIYNDVKPRKKIPHKRTSTFP